MSNLSLKVLDRFFDGKHVIKLLMDNKIKFTINSDDPPLLGGFLNQNYLTVAGLFDEFSENQVKSILIQFARDSFAASFLNEDDKRYYENILNDLVNQN